MGSCATIERPWQSSSSSTFISCGNFKFHRAWTVIQRGKPAKALVLQSDWPVPQKLEKDEVLVKVQAGALNPVGWKLMILVPNMFLKRPCRI